MPNWSYQESKERLERDLEGMKSPGSWPRWPVLPLKRRDRAESGPEMGILAVRGLDEKPEPIVYRTNMFEATSWEKLDENPKYTYESFEALQADGWVVD